MKYERLLACNFLNEEILKSLHIVVKKVILITVALDVSYRQLSQEKDQMAREIDLEKQKKKRLSCHNEELQWKLKKSTEVANHLAVSTKRLSK